MTGTAWSKPAFAIGDFVVLAGETVGAMFRRPFAWRELLDQIWFVARVSIVPTLVLSIPYTVLIVFTLTIVLIEVGAADLSGAGAALASVTHVGPVVTAIVVSGAGATAMCADLGARTIREEIDAIKVIGVNPIQALVVPRVIAATFVALMLYSVVAVVGLSGSYFFVVFVQHVTPGAFVAGMTLLTGLPQVTVSLVKALLFGLSAGLIACYKGLHVGGGPTAVGNAVNEIDSFSTTSKTITTHAKSLDELLLSAVGFSQSGMNTIGGNQPNLMRTMNILDPTTALFMRYSPTYTCLFQGAPSGSRTTAAEMRWAAMVNP